VKSAQKKAKATSQYSLEDFNKLKNDYVERIKELNCLYGFSKIIETPNITLDKIFEKTNFLLPKAWQYPEITCSRIILDGKEFRTKNFNECKWKQCASIRVNGEKTGFIEVCYLKEKPNVAEGPFLLEERHLIDAMAARLGRVVERKRAQEEISKALEKAKQGEAEVSALLAAAKSVLQNRDFNSSARLIFDSCKALIGATSGYVALLSDDGKDNIVLFLESGGLPCTVDPSLPMPIRGLRANAYNMGKAIVENNFANSEWTSFLPKGHVSLRNVLFSPLKVDDKTVGIMGLANKHEGFTKHDAELALAFADIASIALINSKMIDVLEENQKILAVHSENLEMLVEEKSNKLRDSERLAAIGATAGMVGHDIRNPLQSIASDVFLIKSEMSSMPQNEAKMGIEESLAGIEENIHYINKIVQDLQDFSKQFNPELKEISLETICEEVLSKNGIPKNIDAASKVEEQVKKIVADPDILKRILSNLVNNAIQAMPYGGKLILHVYEESGNIEITVKDTGEGIAEEIKPKLFTPLFTTKAKGQGFGLAVVKRMTETLGGTVGFESEIGKGTNFIVRLPIRKAEK
jgi:signal transduction histidine kinase